MRVFMKTHACLIYILTSLCVFSWIIVRKMTLFDFLNINVESMRDPYPESKDRECVMKMLGCEGFLLYFGVIMWTI